MNLNNKILFVIPKVKSMYGDSHAKPLYPHVGIAYLTGFLKKHNYKVKIIDQGINDNSNYLYNTITNFKPLIIGTTGFSYAYGYLESLIKDLKSHTDIPLIVGGPHVSATKEDMLKKTSVDFALAGEGETSFIKFLDEFIKTKPKYQNVPGLIYRNKTAIKINPQSPYITKLDDLPFPDYGAFDLKIYPCATENTLPIITSRGCPYGCNYCSVRLSMGQCFRPRSPENVVKEINYWYKKGFNQFDINDDCFTLDLKRAENICDLIIKKKIKIKIQLYNGIRVDRVTPQLLNKLKKAGCIFISYGCESGSQKIINKIGKNITLQQVRTAVEWTNSAGIKNAVNFIIGHQEESYQDAQETIKFADSLPTSYVNFYNLVPYPGTPVYQWVVKNASFLVPTETFLYSTSYRDNSPIFETKQFTKNQRHAIMKTGFNLYEKKLYRFRFGYNLGTTFYYVTRFKPAFTLLNYIVANNKLSMSLFKKLTNNSRL